MTTQWIRTCQECGHKQVAKQPEYGTEPTDAYRNSKCRRCKSEALDFGKEVDDNPQPEQDGDIT